MSKYAVFSGPYFPAFGLNTEYLSELIPNARKYGPEKTPYLDTFHAVMKKELSVMGLFFYLSRILLRRHCPKNVVKSGGWEKDPKEAMAR